jgi:hypothetical protein
MAAHAIDQRAAAAADFQRSLDLLADRDPYEAARTKAAWGKLLGSDSEQGMALLEEAQAVFAHLGAVHDCSSVASILAKSMAQVSPS